MREEEEKCPKCGSEDVSTHTDQAFGGYLVTLRVCKTCAKISDEAGNLYELVGGKIVRVAEMCRNGE